VSCFDKNASFFADGHAAGSSGSRVISSIISRSCGERTDSWPFGGKRELDGPKADEEADVDVCGGIGR
jgi:hypothetical protein